MILLLSSSLWLLSPSVYGKDSLSQYLEIVTRDVVAISALGFVRRKLAMTRQESGPSHKKFMYVHQKYISKYS